MMCLELQRASLQEYKVGPTLSQQELCTSRCHVYCTTWSLLLADRCWSIICYKSSHTNKNFPRLILLNRRRQTVLWEELIDSPQHCHSHPLHHHPHLLLQESLPLNEVGPLSLPPISHNMCTALNIQNRGRKRWLTSSGRAGIHSDQCWDSCSDQPSVKVLYN